MDRLLSETVPPIRSVPHPAVGQPPRILFYSHDSFGLGHIRRTLAIAGELGRARPEAAMLVLTGSLETHAYDLPPNFDYVKLPAVTKDGNGAYTSRTLPIPFAHTWSLRERIIRESADAFRPDTVVVDHAPAGMRGELVQTLRTLRDRHPRVRLVLGLRDIVDEPSAVRAAWLKDGVYQLLDDVYDRILVYGSRHVFDPIAEYGFSRLAAAKTSFCGYICKQEPIAPPEEIRTQVGAGSRPLVVLTVGGGSDGGALLRTYLAGLASRRPDVAVCVVTGPLLDETERARITATAAKLRHVTVLPSASNLVSYLNAADVVLTMGGYNTVCEAVSLGKRVVIVPRVHPRQEQLIRARRFARLGLVTMVHPDGLTPGRLQDAVRDSLTAAPPAPRLDFDGLRRAGDVLAELLTPPVPVFAANGWAGERAWADD